ncbi:MAG: hypothetical protein R6W91_00605 [Thermoplasmata archaeon]
MEAQLGILQMLPPEYYVAIALSALLLLANFDNKRWGYFFFSMLLLIFTFTCLEAVLYCNPVGATDAYGRYTSGISLAQSANPFFSPTAYPYLYCGSFLYTKVFSIIAGIGNSNTVPFISLFKVLATLSFFSLLYFILLRSMSLRVARLLTVLMVFANPYLQFHYSPPAYGLLFTTILIYTILAQRQNHGKILVIQILLFSFLVITHGPYTLYFTMAYLFTSILHWFFRRRVWAEATVNISIPTAVLFTAGMLLMNPSITMRVKSIITWLSPLSAKVSYVNMVNVSHSIPEHLGYGTLGMERFGTNYIIPETLRILVLASCMIATLWCVWVIIKKKKMDSMNLFLLGATGSFLFFTVGNIIFPVMNLGDRSFLYLIFGSILLLRNIVPSDFSLSGLLRVKRQNTAMKNILAILTILLILSPLANGLTYHYHNGIYFTAPQYADRHLYLYEHSPHSIVYFYRDNSYALYGVNRIGVSLPASVIAQSTYWFYPEDPKLGQYPTFIVMAEPTKWSYSIFGEDSNMQVMMAYTSEEMSLVYSSIGTSVWYKSV